MESIVIYHSNILKYGGIETFLRIFCQQISKHFHVTLLFSAIEDQTQLFEYGCSVQKYIGQPISCDYFISASDWGKIPFQHVTAKKVIQMIHADFSKVNHKHTPHPKITHYVSVSKAIQESFPRSSDVIYNLIDTSVPKIKKVRNARLKLVTCSRISKEKGIQRCIELAKTIKRAYQWDIYGEGGLLPQMKELAKGTNIKFHGYKKDCTEVIAKADFLVQLSDTEGFSYTIQEALYQQTPVIVTAFPVAYEMVEDKKNGYILDFDNLFCTFGKLTPKLYKGKSTPLDWVKYLKS
jgi:glycosyltransferase involved in cell wall biosynthesis